MAEWLHFIASILTGVAAAMCVIVARRQKRQQRAIEQLLLQLIFQLEQATQDVSRSIPHDDNGHL